MLFRDRAIVSDPKGLGSFGRQFIHSEHAGKERDMSEAMLPAVVLGWCSERGVPSALLRAA